MKCVSFGQSFDILFVMIAFKELTTLSANMCLLESRKNRNKSFFYGCSNVNKSKFLLQNLQMSRASKHVSARNSTAKKLDFNMLSAVETKTLNESTSGNLFVGL